jgi:8-oxo-dGTP pyrophosphatase MutT (NUDIX family)/deoxyadenosine/deoxycytidine kinase
MLYRSPQRSFPALFKAVGCVYVHRGKVLLLKRGPEKSYPSYWGLPSGKVHAKETTLRAMVRELFEETAILVSADNLLFVGEFHIVNSDMSFLYSLYRIDVDTPPAVRIQEEHESFGWFEVEEALLLDLVPDLADCLLIAGLGPETTASQLELFPHLREARASSRDLEEPIRNQASDLYHDILHASRPFCITFGPPGGGKSSALEKMREFNPQLVLVVDKEPLRRGSRLRFYLKRIFEHGDQSYFFKFQTEVLPVRLRHTLRAPPNALVDESIYSNHAYSRALRELGWISSQDYQSLYQNYLCYYQLIPRDQSILYFTASLPTILTRIRRRGRVHEKFYSAEYVYALHSAFEAIAQELANDHRVSLINTDTLTPEEIARTYGPEARNRTEPS